MMLAKIYGEAIYFDDPLSEYQDIAKYPKLGFDQIIDKCLELMNTGMYGVDGKQITRWRTFLFPSITGENEGHMRCLQQRLEKLHTYIFPLGRHYDGFVQSQNV